jgi:hypothetical protein
MVCWSGLYEAGWTAPLTSQPPTSSTGHSAAVTIVQPGTEGLRLSGDAVDDDALYVGWKAEAALRNSGNSAIRDADLEVTPFRAGRLRAGSRRASSVMAPPGS